VEPSPALEEALECALVKLVRSAGSVGSARSVGSAGLVRFARLVGFAELVGLIRWSLRPP
jgi:hypothetical protein